MKKFINEHPRLYWMIVILIAGLVFGIVTGIGCAKLEKAEAAVTSDGSYYPDLWTEVDWTGFEQYKEAIKNRNSNFIVINTDGLYVYYFTDGTSWLTGMDMNGKAAKYVHVLDYLYLNGKTLKMEYVEPLCDKNMAFWYFNGSKYVEVVGSTYDYGVSDLPHSNISYVYVAEPKYLVNAPFLEYQSVEKQSNYVDGKIYAIDEGYHTINYKIAGQPMTPPDGYEVLYEYRVYLPTKDYFRQFFREDMLPTLEGLETMKSNIPKWRRNSVGSSDSRLWIFNLDRSIEAEKTNGDDVRIRLDYADIQTEIEEFNSVSLKEYYGFDDDAWSAYGKYIMAHLVVYRVDCIVYTYNTPDIYYGRNVTVHFPPYLERPIVTEYNGDYFNPDYDYDAELDTKIDQALKDAKEESDALLEEYKGMISNQENMFGSFDSEFADVGLWGALRGIGSGFLGLTGFITNFAVLIGGIFSFVPIAFQQYVGYTLLAILLIGLWKTIKG